MADGGSHNRKEGKDNMKKLYAIALLGLMVLGLAATASAADIKASGKWQIEATMQNADFQDKGATSEDKQFNIEQRVRTAFQFIANENLKGVLDLQIGSANWGNGAFGIGAGRSAATSASSNANNAGSGNIMLRRGYVDFKWPNTKVNFLVGFQTVSLPAAFGGGSAILDDQVAAAIVSAPITDNISILAGYARPYDTNGSVSTDAGALTGGGTSADMVFAAVPLDFKGLNITPFAAYASIGSKLGAPGLAGLATGNATAGEGANAYWGGIAATVTMLDNFKFMGDFNYGKLSFNKNNTPTSSVSRSGWMADIAVDYTGFKMMTPSAFFVYSSGERGNSTEHSGSSRMPSLGNPQNWAVGSFFFGDRNFINGFPSSAGYAQRVMGFWTAGVSLKDIKLIDKMSHTAHLLYVKGTNDKNSVNEVSGVNINTANNMNYGGFLTTKDSLWEVDFNTKYMIYDELAVNLDLGYINASFDKDVWGTSAKTYKADYQNYGSNDAYSVRLGVAYSF
jgi:hypothetical protein